jgi:hypothetical protein
MELQLITTLLVGMADLVTIVLEAVLFLAKDENL